MMKEKSNYSLKRQIYLRKFLTIRAQMLQKSKYTKLSALTVNTHSNMCISGGKKCQFSENSEYAPNR